MAHIITQIIAIVTHHHVDDTFGMNDQDDDVIIEVKVVKAKFIEVIAVVDNKINTINK